MKQLTILEETGLLGLLLQNIFLGGGLPSADESLDRLLLYIACFISCAFCNVDTMVGRSNKKNNINKEIKVNLKFQLPFCKMMLFLLRISFSFPSAFFSLFTFFSFSSNSSRLKRSLSESPSDSSAVADLLTFFVLSLRKSVHKL